MKKLYEQRIRLLTVTLLIIVGFGNAIVVATQWQSVSDSRIEPAGGVVTFFKGKKAVVAVCGPTAGSRQAVSIKNLDGPDERYHKEVASDNWMDMDLVLYTWIPLRTARYRVMAHPNRGGDKVFMLFNND